jgi:hypothetical protein
MKGIITIGTAVGVSIIVIIKLMVPLLARLFGVEGVDVWVPVWLARRIPFPLTLFLSFGLGPLLLLAIWFTVWLLLSKWTSPT